MPARHAAFQLGGGPWYGYWYGVIHQVVEGESYVSPSQSRFRGGVWHQYPTSTSIKFQNVVYKFILIFRNSRWFSFPADVFNARVI